MSVVEGISVSYESIPFNVTIAATYTIRNTHYAVRPKLRLPLSPTIIEGMFS